MTPSSCTLSSQQLHTYCVLHHSLALFFRHCSLFRLFFFFNDPAPTEISTLPLHDALPISWMCSSSQAGSWNSTSCPRSRRMNCRRRSPIARPYRRPAPVPRSETASGRTCSSSSSSSDSRSEEHTSELQSHSDLVCRLLLEK